MSDRFDEMAREAVPCTCVDPDPSDGRHDRGCAHQYILGSVTKALRSTWNDAIEAAAAQSKASWKAWSVASPVGGATKAAACALSAIIEVDIRELKEPKR